MCARIFVYLFALNFGETTENTLAERNPAPLMGFVTDDVVLFGADAHRQHVIGKPGRFVPCWSQRHMTFDLLGVGERFHPAETIGVGPDRVIDTREVGVEFASPLIEKVRKQDRHLVIGEGKFFRPLEVVPALDSWSTKGCGGLELVPAIAASSADGRDRAGHDRNEEEATGNLPTTLISRPGGAPVVRGELRWVLADDLGDLADLASRNARDVFCPLGRVLGVVRLEGGTNARKLVGHLGELLGEERLPVHPTLDKVFVPRVVFEHLMDDREAQKRLGAGPRR